MTNTIFDFFQEAPEGEEGFMQIASDLPQPTDNSWLKSSADVGKTILKGTVEGITRLGRIMGPLEGEPTPQLLEKQTESLDELLPTDEGFVQTSLRRGLREAPTALAFPGSKLSTLPRSILSGFMGQAAEDLGAPEWAQTAAELTAYLSPDFTKKLISQGKNKPIIDAGKKFGLTDEQIAPLLQPEFKQRWLAKLSPRTGRTKTILESTKKGLGEAYEGLKKSPESGIQLPEAQVSKTLKKMGEIGFDIPNVVREKVNKDMVELLRKPITPKSLIDLHRKINKSLGPKTKEISLFKEPIKEAIASVSPELADNFGKINDLFSRYFKIAGKLKPTLVSDLIRAGEALGIIGSVVSGNPVGIQALLAEKGVKMAARELLTNPRLQQLGEKFLLALNQNKWPVAAKLTSQMEKLIESKDENLDVESISEEDLKKYFG